MNTAIASNTSCQRGGAPRATAISLALAAALLWLPSTPVLATNNCDANSQKTGTTTGSNAVVCGDRKSTRLNSSH